MKYKPAELRKMCKTLLAIRQENPERYIVFCTTMMMRAKCSYRHLEQFIQQTAKGVSPHA